MGETDVLGEKPVLVPFCPPHISDGLTRDRTWALKSIYITYIQGYS